MIWRFWGLRSAPPSTPASTYDPALEPAPLGDVVQRGEAAARLLNDATLAEAFADIRQEAYQDWLGSKPTDRERREELYRITRALDLVRSKLIAYRGAASVRRAAEG